MSHLKFPADDYPECPAGLWPATCIDVVDFGLEDTDYGPTYKIGLVFQVNVDKEVYYLRKKMPFKSHPRSTMGKTVKSWTGSLPKKDEDPADYYRKQAQINVIHEPKIDGDGVWVNIDSVLPAGNVEIPRIDLEGYRIPDGGENQGQSVIHEAPATDAGEFPYGLSK